MEAQGSSLPGVSSRVRRQRSKKSVQHTEKSAHCLSKEDIAKFINSRKQNICVGLLQHGFHRSFSELFLLLRLDQERREGAEINSALSLQTPLEEQHAKMESIGLYLSRAEQAQRDGRWPAAYEQRLHLGAYFTAELEDLWLSLHFYHTCTDAQEEGCKRHATEGRACLAELYLQQGQLDKARHQAELCVQMADEGGWVDSSSRYLPRRARESLWSIYSRQADARIKVGKPDKALELLHKGYTTATESANKNIEGEAAYQLGLAYYRVGDYDTSKQYLNTSMTICSSTENFDGLGKAYKAMAKLYESKGNIKNTIKLLETLVDISRSKSLHHHLVDACLCLGHVYTNMKQYDQARESLLQGYNVACDIGDVALVQKAQVSLASAHTRCIVGKYSADVESATSPALSRLLAWKVSRGLHETSGNADICDY
ncbi:tetratricopeptide repeat protein 29 [Syngnathus acus]|uniref:tetratricopeptide repeat protein 29 n=1 Tax=Syngnathus acus TaxID=161584 RepID=UPI0018860C80|nr:tetratricopeptide repeat protein 29 [Syngnathus acus]XP_037116255.1 tetratricopeptide repeat protein 29 [Syngnathus acus]XP_037116256.1 tetratricopeptide repeat protein 29 [Syngnathus acus]